VDFLAKSACARKPLNRENRVYNGACLGTRSEESWVRTRTLRVRFSFGPPGEKGGTMKRRCVVAISILTLCIATVSCTKLQSPGPLTREAAKFTDAIPKEYGSLVGLTYNQAQGWAGLWFQAADGTITMVSVSPEAGKIGEKIITIPRK